MATGRARESARVQREYGGRPAEARDADRRRRLFEAGLQSFGTVGYFGTSIEALCTAAHVSNRSFYEHFDSKEDLLVAIYDELLEDLQRRVVEALSARQADFAAFAHAGLEAFIEILREDDRKAQIVIVGLIGVSERCEHHRRSALRAFAQVISDGVRTFDAEIERTRDLKVLSMALVGATIESLIDWMSAPDASIGDVIDELVHLYTAAVA